MSNIILLASDQKVMQSLDHQRKVHYIYAKKINYRQNKKRTQ